jgi:hypothetical protein
MGRFSALLALVSLSSLTAQTPDTATVHGRVLDPSRAPAVGVSVKVTNSLTNAVRFAQTDDSGNFTLAGLPIAGSYTIAASKTGFADSKVENLTLAGGTTADIAVELNVAKTQVQVTVTGVPGEIRTDSSQLGDRLDGRQMEETPLPNRRITFLPLLNAANRPAINQGDVFMNENLFTTNGAGRRQAWFEVDGSTANDSWGRQTIFSNLPITSLQEMNVIENGFSAEYGGGTGSAVNIITKSGGSKLHGDILELWRPAGPEAALSGFTQTNAASGNDITRDTLGQSAISLGGPVGAHGSEPGKTHFMFAGEYSRQDRVSLIIAPVAPGSFVGHYRGWLGFARIDHQLNDRVALFFRSNLDGFHDTNPNGAVGGNNLPTVDRVFKRRTYSEELGETVVLSSTLLNTARVQFQLASPITQFDPVINGTQFVVPIAGVGTFTTGTSQSALLMNRQYQVNDTLSASWGKHQVKFGADVIVAHTGGNSKEFGGPIYLGSFSYKSCDPTKNGGTVGCESQTYLGNIANVNTYTQSYGNANYTVTDTLWAMFVQDDYHVRPNLTLNLGLRYEQQTFTDSRKDFAPRIGFAYNWRGDGKTVIRGGFGIYYSQIVDNSAANWALTGPTGVFNFTASAGQIGFPTSVTAVPLPAFPAGAVAPLRNLYVRPGDSQFLNQFFPTSTLTGYQAQLLNPYSEQWTFGVERRLAPNWVLRVDYVGSHSLRINRPLDVDTPAPFVRTAAGQVRTAQQANCTRPYWIAFYKNLGAACNPSAATNPQPAYAQILSDVNDGYAYYDALDVNLSHQFSNRFQMLASYVWSHAIDNVDPDLPGQNPNDPNFIGKVENANAIYDQRQRFVISGTYILPLKIRFGGVGTLGSGLPFNYVTGSNNFGDSGASTDRPVINGVVIGRNAGHGRPIYDVSPFVERPFTIGERLRIDLRAEAFNVLNHANFTGYIGTWGNGVTAVAGFGTPAAGITNQLLARSMQFSVRVAF